MQGLTTLFPRGTGVVPMPQHFPQLLVAPERQQAWRPSRCPVDQFQMAHESWPATAGSRRALLPSAKKAPGSPALTLLPFPASPLAFHLFHLHTAEPTFFCCFAVTRLLASVEMQRTTNGALGHLPWPSPPLPPRPSPPLICGPSL